MMRLPLLLLIVLSLSSCGWLEPYKINVQQGNVIKQAEVDQLQPGMTRKQVRYLLGAPMITDTFNQDRWDYVYSMQLGGKDRQQKRITLWFKGDILNRITGDYRPGGDISEATKSNALENK